VTGKQFERFAPTLGGVSRMVSWHWALG
jgi:hypothetical protein